MDGYPPGEEGTPVLVEESEEDGFSPYALVVVLQVAVAPVQLVVQLREELAKPLS